MKEVNEKSVRERILQIQHDRHDIDGGISIREEFELDCLRKLLPTMTTNSPNLVDGDVQSYQMPLLTDGERDKAISDFTVRAVNTDCDVSLLAYQIALAALTAEPSDRIVDDGCSQRIGCVQVSDKLNCTWPLGTQFYTTPPPQLLRPVELPEGRLMQVAFETDPVNADMYLCISRDAAVRAIQLAGGEVKHD